MTFPKKLKPGDTIGIIAPCYSTTPKDLEPPVRFLKSKGFRVKFAGNAFKDTYGFAASPEERADDFNSMINDGGVDMLFFNGGEVCNEILPYVDFEAVKKHPKILCSMSDSTTILNAVTANTSLVTYYGSIGAFYQPSDYNVSQFESLLMKGDARELRKNSIWTTIRGGSCEGKLVGGYLPNFALMMNGKYLPYDRSEKYILFAEEHINFHIPAVVSRYFSHMEQSGFFEHIAGIVFGHYSTDYYPEINDILRRLANKYRIPVVKCEDFGHGANNAVLPIGIQVSLDADSQSLRFLQDTIK